MKFIIPLLCSIIGFAIYITMGIIRGLNGGWQYYNPLVINLGVIGLGLVTLGVILITIFTISENCRVDTHDKDKTE